MIHHQATPILSRLNFGGRSSWQSVQGLFSSSIRQCLSSVNFDPSREKDAREKINEVWNKLSEGGTVLMPLDKYPFSEKYGWIQDKYGLSWQLILTNPEGEERPALVPSLLFVGDQCGNAEEAIDFYLSVFKNSKQGHIARYPKGMEPDKEGTIMFTDFSLKISGFPQWIARMSINSILMRPSHLWCTATHKKRLITTGKSSLQFLKPSNAAG